MNFNFIWENLELVFALIYIAVCVIAFLLGWKFYDKRATAVALESRLTYAIRWALFRWIPGLFHFSGFVIQLFVKWIAKLLIDSSFSKENGNGDVNHRFGFFLRINGDGIKLVLIKTAEVVDGNVIHVPNKGRVIEGIGTKNAQG